MLGKSLPLPLLSLQLSGRVLLVLTSCKRNPRLKTICCRTRLKRVLHLDSTRGGHRPLPADRPVQSNFFFLGMRIARAVDPVFAFA